MADEERFTARSRAEWEGLLADTHVGFDVRAPAGGPGPVAGEVTRRSLGAVSIVDCRCLPWTGRRGPAALGDAGAGRIGVQIVLRGAERIRRGGTERLLSAGDLGIWDGVHALGIEVLAPFVKRTLVFPRDLVLAASPRLADVDDVPGFGALPGARLLARYTDAVLAELPGMDEATRATAGDVTLELLRAAVEPLLPADREARLEALRARARRVARARLGDPALAPEGIAQALSVSLRTLHGAFEGSGETVSSMVRRARLARCHQDLADPAAGTVTEIAYRWGFSDATHFSQAFKREYGCSPREVRARSAPDAARAPGAGAARSTRQPRAEPMA